MIKDKNSALEVLEVSGEPIEIGRQIGIAKQMEIKEFVNILHNNYCKCVGKFLSIDDLVDTMSESIKRSQKYCPDMYDELLGISQGSGIDMNNNCRKFLISLDMTNIYYVCSICLK